MVAFDNDDDGDKCIKYCTIPYCQHVVIAADDKPSILSFLSSITTLKSSLADFTEPDFGLLNELLGLHVLTRRQAASVRKKQTVFDRNDALLELLTSEEQCVKFLTALQRTAQQHVVNFIKQNGGQKHNDDITYLVSVLCGEEQTVRRTSIYIIFLLCIR